MGYYTDFTLKLHGTKADLEDIKNFINSEEDDGFENCGYRELEFWPYSNEEGTNAYITYEWFGGLKWYDWFEEMEALSAAFPEICFCLEGAGEERDDLWRARFENGIGRREYAKIVWETI